MNTSRHPFPNDREPLPYFAGRVDEMSVLNARLDKVLAGSVTGGIALVAGVPGAGKSELGRQFVKRAIGRGKSPTVICHLPTDVSLLASDLGMFKEMSATLGRSDVGRRVAEIDTKGTGWSAGGGSVKVQRTTEHVRHTGTLYELLRSSVRAGMWTNKALILTVDELQTVDPEAMPNLHMLHKGEHGCPILVVGIGLQHTQDVLAHPSDGSAGISRIAHPVTLGCLARDETVDAVEGNMRAFGCEVSEGGAEALAKASFGFPQHIHAYLEAAVGVIRARGSLDERAKLDEAIDRGNKRRIRYYQDRLRSMTTRAPFDAMMPMVAALEAQKTDALSESAAIAACTTGKLDGEAIVDDAIAHGVLTRHPDGTIGFGIPSFRDYMAEQLRLLRRERPA